MLKLLTPQLRAPLNSVGIRSFMTTPKRQIFEKAGIPPPPGYIVGTVNDAVKPNPVDRFHGSYHWGFERIVTVAMVPLIVYPFVTGSLPPVADFTLGALLISHCHAGFGSCITDYIPKRKFPKLHPFSFYLLGAGCATALYGVYKLETEEEGLVGAAKTLWKA